MANDDKDDVREDSAEAKDAASTDQGSDEKGDGSTGGEKSAAKHEPERSAAEEHLAKKERTEELLGAAKSGVKREAEAGHTHGPAHGPGQGHHAAGHHKPNRKEYLVIFVVLFVLTVLEVAVAQVPGISKNMMALALVALAVTKAAFVGLYYMHLKHETRILKLTVAIPLATPAVYALVLIAEAAWRLTR
jgi:cytochrome c oxidase subunit 4